MLLEIRLGFGRGGVDDGCDRCDDVGGEAALCGVFADVVLAGGDVDAVDFVRRDEGLDPLNLRPHDAEDVAGFLRDGG